MTFSALLLPRTELRARALPRHKAGDLEFTPLNDSLTLKRGSGDPTIGGRQHSASKDRRGPDWTAWVSITDTHAGLGKRNQNHAHHNQPTPTPEASLRLHQIGHGYCGSDTHGLSPGGGIVSFTGGVCPLVTCMCGLETLGHFFR